MKVLVSTKQEARSSPIRDAAGFTLPAFREAVILSTCNRTEFYLVSTKQKTEPWKSLEAFIKNFHSMPIRRFKPHLYIYPEREAVAHLFLVASGMDSQVVGEAQILGQVRNSFEVAHRVGGTGPLLSELFRHAVRVGKKVRRETAIGQKPTSISSVAVKLLSKVLVDIKRKEVLVIGTGKVNEITMRQLAKIGVQNLVVVSRTFYRAKTAARKLGGRSLPIAEISTALETADVVISSTTAPHLIIEASTLRKVMRKRGQSPLLLMDLAVPRDIDPQIKRIEGVTLYNVDDLKSIVDTGLQERKKEARKVNSIVEEEVEHFLSWFRTREIVPTLVALRERLETFRKLEIKRALKGIPPPEADKFQIPNLIDGLTKRLLNKILHEPTVRLKGSAGTPFAPSYSKALQDLFDLKAGSVKREAGSAKLKERK